MTSSTTFSKESLVLEGPIPDGGPQVVLQEVSVRYRLPKERFRTIKEYAIRFLRRKVEYEEFWGLRQVSCQAAPGEMLGIIGRNGAGKSTLVKVVARLIKPITGSVKVNGRVSPLIELGAGFDYELTGRENIYLYGSILGIGRKTMNYRFQEIVEFSELADFIDSPLRTYSSGMAARLGFAIATSSHPEILILDEILAVGDARFQQKSYKRIQGFRGQGVTILFVSHDLNRVRELCHRTLWLEQGRLMAWGDSGKVVDEYLRFVDGNS